MDNQQSIQHFYYLMSVTQYRCYVYNIFIVSMMVNVLVSYDLSIGIGGPMYNVIVKSAMLSL